MATAGLIELAVEKLLQNQPLRFMRAASGRTFFSPDIGAADLSGAIEL